MLVEECLKILKNTGFSLIVSLDDLSSFIYG